jgi:light-regulated signal transduction histidine kinase (bacteriophytochrome)
MKKTEEPSTNIIKLKCLLEEKETLIILLENKVKSCSSELIEAKHELETFGYTVSHDLQTPLRAIGIFVQVLLEDYADKLDDTGKRYLKSIDMSSNEMSILIDDLLCFSRLATVELTKKEIRK